jgi:hypothetical protein
MSKTKRPLKYPDSRNVSGQKVIILPEDAGSTFFRNVDNSP